MPGRRNPERPCSGRAAVDPFGDPFRYAYQTRSWDEPQPSGVPGPPGCGRGAMADVAGDYEATNGSRSNI
jgi:hypothetical protein